VDFWWQRTRVGSVPQMPGTLGCAAEWANESSVEATADDTRRALFDTGGSPSPSRSSVGAAIFMARFSTRLATTLRSGCGTTSAHAVCLHLAAGHRSLRRAAISLCAWMRKWDVLRGFRPAPGAGHATVETRGDGPRAALL
ncbi:hypothetical protein TraAM80_09526, partial [Trypanosoma rangeli]